MRSQGRQEIFSYHWHIVKHLLGLANFSGRQDSGKELVEDDAKGIDVGRGSYPLQVTELFRSHVG